MASSVYPWINWRTPDSEKIYPTMEYANVCTMLNESSVNANHESEEIVGKIWINIEHALNRSECDDIHLAPPQWFMLKEMEKYQNDAEYENAVRIGKYPKFIQSRLVSSENSNVWHSILYNNNSF